MAGPGSVALVSSTSDPTGTSRWLRLGQHALLAVLAVVCAVRAIADGTHPAAELAALALFAGWYALGPRVARAGRDGTGWLVGLVLLWGLLVVVSPENVWLAFPLWLLAGHVLPLLPAVLTSLAVLVVVALEPVRHSGEVSYAAIIGPCIGMVVALGVARAQQALVRDGIERQRLIASLYAAQEESAALTDELARVQRAQGVTSERTRLSRDIHDGIAQGFSSLLLLSRAARAESDAQRRAQLLEHIESGAAQGLEESRRIVGALAPTDLDEGSLAAAIRRVADRFAAESGVRATVTASPDLPPVPTTVEVALLRLVQGALANVRTHAGAETVGVSLEEAGTTVRVDVVDDGVGFDPTDWWQRPSPTSGEGGYGLRATRARLRELGGGLSVESAPGEGTAVSGWVEVGR